MSPHEETSRLPEPGCGTDAPAEAGIRRIGAARRDEAIEMLVGGSGGEGFLAYAGSHDINLDVLYARFDDRGRITSVALGVPGHGGTGMVFASRARRSTSQQRQLGLVIGRAASALAEHNVRLAQALIEPGDGGRAAAYAYGGFQFLARLSYMERVVPTRRSMPPAVEWPEDVSVDVYGPDDRRALLDVLDASYEQTLDCPGLCGLRTTDEILSGHETTGNHDPRLWAILRADGRAAGALLLNPSVAGDQIELVYMGLARPLRGRGLGAALLQHGLRLVAGRPERTVTLAVDDDNRPARAMYERAGFRRVLRRTALIRPQM